MSVTAWVTSALLAALLLVSGYAYIEREARIAAADRADRAEAQVQAERKGLKALADEMRAATGRLQATQRVRDAVIAAPNSRVCADSPAVRAALDGLRAGSGSAANPRRPDGTSTPPRAAGGAN